MHYKTKNFKSAVFGSKLRIARLVLTFAPLIALVLPLYNFTLNLPFRSGNESISFLTFILDYLLKVDIGSVITLMGGEVLGKAVTMVVIACVLLLLAVVFGVLNFFVILLSGFKLKYKFNTVYKAQHDKPTSASTILLLYSSCISLHYFPKHTKLLRPSGLLPFFLLTEMLLP